MSRHLNQHLSCTDDTSGPLASRAARKAGYHLRRASDESNDSDEGRQKLLKEDEERFIAAIVVPCGTDSLHSARAETESSVVAQSELIRFIR